MRCAQLYHMDTWDRQGWPVRTTLATADYWRARRGEINLGPHQDVRRNLEHLTEQVDTLMDRLRHPSSRRSDDQKTEGKEVVKEAAVVTIV